jgi:integrase
LDSAIAFWSVCRQPFHNLVLLRGADVEVWLDSAELQELSNGTKAKIRNIMSSIYSHAKRQGWIQFNPISTVRQSAQREHVPEVLTPAEARMIAEAIELSELALAILGMGNGPRVSESLALKWEDLDFAGKQMQIRRSIWHQRINEKCKTANSRKTVPLHDLQISILLEWRCVFTLQPTWRLGFRQSADARQATILAGTTTQESASDGKTARHQQESRLAHFPAHSINHAPSERRGHRYASRIVA